MGNRYKRREAQRSIRKVLIVCEGEKTERYYFEAFQINKELIKVEVLGAGMNTDSLVEHAINLKNSANREELYSAVWCVFDRDTYPCNPNDKHNFNRAIDIANRNQIRVAYSNDAFEIWYILHFNYHQTAWTRDKYENKLTELLDVKYEKNDQKMYEKLKDKQGVAIQNAKRLLALYGFSHNPESDNPCTTVHRLVAFLNDYLESE
ncbi:MAG: RloB family protein [Candidatus Saganbacteria bacterium]|nr:RloB family protein [Candidatus Saganbacteria bacterium]